MTQDQGNQQSQSRREILKKGAVASTAVTMGLSAGVGSAAAQDDGNQTGDETDEGAPEVPLTIFDGFVYANDNLYGTVITGPFEPPEKVSGSTVDILYTIVDGRNPKKRPQFEVSEVAPGDPDYNFGRWFDHIVRVTNYSAYGDVKPLTSEHDILQAAANGIVEIEKGNPPQALTRWTFFRCPLFPYPKEREPPVNAKTLLGNETAGNETFSPAPGNQTTMLENQTAVNETTTAADVNVNVTENETTQAAVHDQSATTLTQSSIGLLAALGGLGSVGAGLFSRDNDADE